MGFPLHLWKEEVLREVGNRCGRFIDVDEATRHFVDLRWSRLLVRVDDFDVPHVLMIRVRGMSFKLQLWWEFPPQLDLPVSAKLSEKAELKRKVGGEVSSCVGVSVGQERQTDGTLGKGVSDDKSSLGGGRVGDGVVRVPIQVDPDLVMKGNERIRLVRGPVMKQAQKVIPYGLVQRADISPVTKGAGSLWKKGGLLGKQAQKGNSFGLEEEGPNRQARLHLGSGFEQQVDKVDPSLSHLGLCNEGLSVKGPVLRKQARTRSPVGWRRRGRWGYTPPTPTPQVNPDS